MEDAVAQRSAVGRVTVAVAYDIGVQARQLRVLITYLYYVAVVTVVLGILISVDSDIVNMCAVGQLAHLAACAVCRQYRLCYPEAVGYVDIYAMAWLKEIDCLGHGDVPCVVLVDESLYGDVLVAVAPFVGKHDGRWR